jgi:two-component system, sensor histidine kinase PdtaS
MPAYRDDAGFTTPVRSAAHSPLMKTSQIMNDGGCFRTLVDMITDCAIYVLDPDGIVVTWNPGAERIHGYSAAEITGRHFSCCFIEEDQRAEKPTELLTIADRTGRIEEEGWRVRKNGGQFRAHAVVDAIRDPDGRLIGFVKLTRDMTEQNRSDEALRRSEERFRRVVEATPNAMVMIDRAGRIEMVNAQTERVFGYARAELLGQPMEMLVPERLRGRHPGLRTTFYDDPLTRPMGAGRDLYGLRKDGSEFAVEIGLNPIETDEGTMVLSAIVDISTRKREEARVLAALKEKDILLGEIHHRVKNNLQIVDSLLGLQSGTVDDTGLQDILRESQNRIKSMALIHQILYQSNDFARIDFSNFLDTLVPALASAYGADPDRIAIAINAIEVRLPVGVAIPCGLLVNELVSNALKHAFPGDRNGEIRIDLGIAADGQILLSVEDDGVGIPDDLDLDQTATLGLQLVMLLTDQIGGEIAIRRSNPTRFALQLPLTVEDRVQ